MKFFSLTETSEVHVAPDTKVIPAEEFSTLQEAHSLLEKAKLEAAKHKVEVEESAKKQGFEEGQSAWSEQIALLEQEIKTVRNEMEKAMTPLAITAVKKILGKELEMKPKAVVDIICTALKAVSQHRKVTLYVAPAELDLVESERGQIKNLFEHLESLSIAPREDIHEGGCIIETEAGIINAQLDNLLKTLEEAFQTFFTTQKKES